MVGQVGESGKKEGPPIVNSSDLRKREIERVKELMMRTLLCEIVRVTFLKKIEKKIG